MEYNWKFSLCIDGWVKCEWGWDKYCCCIVGFYEYMKRVNWWIWWNVIENWEWGVYGIGGEKESFVKVGVWSYC